MNGPLAGRVIAVTRPRAQSAELVRCIGEAGGQALLAPLLDIVEDIDTATLPAIAAKLDSYRLAIFISPNAVAYGMPALTAGRSWPAQAVPAAVGQGTARALVGCGMPRVIVPTERFDSEALLALPELSPENVRGRQCLIVRGHGGRELLVDTLRQRGALVDSLSCYRRLTGEQGIAALRAAWASRLDALIVTSSEALAGLNAALAERERLVLRDTRVFVPHARIAETAANLGIRHTILTGPGDAGIVATLSAYNWAQS